MILARRPSALARHGARDQAPEFLSAHPSHGNRIEALEAQMDEALAEYREAGCPPLEGV